jgi:hypothetical protein
LRNSQTLLVPEWRATGRKKRGTWALRGLDRSSGHAYD